MYYVSADGTFEEVASEYVDGMMLFTVGHFSNYAIVYEPGVGNDEFPAVSIVILVMAISFLAYFRVRD